MRIIVPIFHEIFSPPLGFDSLVEKNLCQIPKTIKYQLERYEIVMIPRKKDDDDGILTLGICDWQTHEGLLGRARRIIDKAEECVKND